MIGGKGWLDFLQPVLDATNSVVQSVAPLVQPGAPPPPKSPQPAVATTQLQGTSNVAPPFVGRTPLMTPSSAGQRQSIALAMLR